MKRILPLLFLTFGVGVAAADHHETGFISLFDGKTLDGWDGKPAFWSVQDGAITGITTKENPTKGNTFIIWRGGTVDDFELQLKFKIVGGNSGIQYRSKELGDYVVSGYQGDFESGDTFSGILYEEKGRGILARRGQVTRVVPNGDKSKVEVVASVGDTKIINEVIKKEDWNDYKIIADGHRVLHAINDRVTAIVVDLDKERRPESGILALQLHAGPPMKVQFKDIRLRPMGGIPLAGDWDVEVEFDGANTGNPKFSFRTEEGKLKGDYDGLFGTAKVSAKTDGNTVRWAFASEYNDMNIECVYEGKFAGFGKITGVVRIEGDAGEVQGTFTAKRR